MSIPNTYLKYIVAALIIAVSAQGLTIYLLERVGIMEERIHKLDTELAVLDERMGFVATLAKNTESYEAQGGYNSAEQNVTK